MATLNRIALGMFLAGCCAISAYAQSDIMFWLDPNLDDFHVHAEYEGAFHLEDDLEDYPGDLDMNQHDLRLAVPLYKDDDHFFAVSTSLGYWDVDSDSPLPDTGAAFPGDLYDIDFSLNYFHYFDNGWTAGGILSAGSPSDEPFNSYDETELQFNGFLRIPHVDNNYWVIVLNWSNNREFLNDIPIPGFGYWYEPSDDLFIMAGIPFLAVRWHPCENVTIRASYIPVRNVDAEIAYSVTDQIDLFGAFEWENDRFLIADRADNDDRLFYYEKNVEAGVRYRFCEAASVQVSGGYSFDRFYFFGEDYDDRHDDRLNIEDGPFVRTKVTVRF